jgi:hypothetical protein
MPEVKMLILRGIAGHYAGRDWPRGALDEPSALEYGRRKGYVGQVLNVAGATGPKSSQTLMALAEFHRDPTVAALYGFSVEVVTLRLFDPAPTREHYKELLAWPLFTHEKTRFGSRQEFLDYLLSCRNEHFTFPGISVCLPESPLIYLPLRRSAV